MVIRRHSEAGYNLVFLMVIVTVLNVIVAATLPHWTTQAQREREEEAIFRGLQYAEAIRVFQNRFGRPPVRLQELVEVEPRSIRQLWGDPLNDGAEWGVLFAGQGGGTVRPDGGAGGDDRGNLSGDSGLGSTTGGGGQGEVQTQGPIAGVYSRAEGDAIKVFNGAQSYGEWEFTVTLVTQLMGGGPAAPGNQPQGPDADGRPRNQNPQNPQNPGQPGQPGAPGLIQPGLGPPDLSVRWLGRPWPEEIQSQMNAGAAMNQGGAPAGQPGSVNGIGVAGAQGSDGSERGGDGGRR